MFGRQQLKEGTQLLLKTDTGEPYVFYLGDLHGKAPTEIGEGSSIIAYRAYRQIGSDSYSCVLKELYPENVGLRRTPDGHLTFYGNSESEREAYQKIYARKRSICEKSYKIMLDAYNDSGDSVINRTVSTPLGLFHDNGIIYTAFRCDVGELYWNRPWENEPLSTTLDIIIQLAKVVKKYHDRGLLCLDIKEKNVFIVGEGDYLSIILFDFNSFIPTRPLKDFQCGSRYDELSLDSTTNPKEVLAPPELTSIINRISDARAIGLSDTADDIDLVEYINDLGENGHKTDMFLIGSLLFKRVFGYVAPQELIKGSPSLWELPESGKLEGRFVKTELKTRLKEILSKAMAPEAYRRYKTMDEFIAALEQLRSFAELEKNYADYTGKLTVREVDTSFPRLLACSMEHLYRSEGDKEKFGKLNRLAVLHNSRVMLKDSQGEKLLPGDALSQDGNIFLYGDGGMGKSTSLYHYWKERVRLKDQVCFYVELNRYCKINSKGRNRCSDFIMYYIIQNIYHNDKDTPWEKLEELDRDIYQQMESLRKQQFEKPTDNAEFVILLDGCNEIAQSEKPTFYAELKTIVHEWTNVKFVVTTRNFPASGTSEQAVNGEDSLYDVITDEAYSFSHFEFVGVSEQERAKALTDGGFTQEEADAIRETNSGLWEILRIPMFLNMFLALDKDAVAEINTRGEILRAFVESEFEVAKRNSEAAVQDSTLAAYRNFVITCALPFAANRMDRENRYYLKADRCFDSLYDGFALYVNNRTQERGFSKRPVPRSRQMEYDEERVENILTDEAGYCSISKDGNIEFIHQYFRDYFAAMYIHNLLTAVQKTEFSENDDENRRKQLDFIMDFDDHHMNYIWSNDVCILLGEITGDYKNAPKRQPQA